MRPVLSNRAFPCEEVRAEQAVEINQHHNIHHHHTGKKKSTIVQPGVVVDDVSGEVELGAQTKDDVGYDVGKFVVVIQGGVVSGCQLQHQPQVQSDAVNFNEESDHTTGHVQVSEEGVQETGNHQYMME